MSIWPGYLRVLKLLLLVGIIGCCGCQQRRGPRASSPAPVVSLVTLASSAAVLVKGNTVRAVAPDGSLAWSWSLPRGEVPITPAAGAANSTTYVRTERALYAVSAEGKQLWRQALPPVPVDARPADYAPIALTDSSVAVLVDIGVFRAFYRSGAERWTMKLPGGGSPIAPPHCAQNGIIIVATASGVLGISPRGAIDWHLRTVR